jgi:hypothetical protein
MTPGTWHLALDLRHQPPGRQRTCCDLDKARPRITRNDTRTPRLARIRPRAGRARGADLRAHIHADIVDDSSYPADQHRRRHNRDHRLHLVRATLGSADAPSNRVPVGALRSLERRDLLRLRGLRVFSFIFTVALETIAGYSPVKAGSTLLPITIIALVLSGPSGRLSARIGPRLQMTAGPIVCGIATLMASRSPRTLGIGPLLSCSNASSAWESPQWSRR